MKKIPAKFSKNFVLMVKITSPTTSEIPKNINCLVPNPSSTL